MLRIQLGALAPSMEEQLGNKVPKEQHAILDAQARAALCLYVNGNITRREYDRISLRFVKQIEDLIRKHAEKIYGQKLPKAKVTKIKNVPGESE